MARRRMKYDGWLLPVLLLAMLPARAQQDSVRVAETLVADSVATMAPDSLAAEGVVDSTMLEGKFNALRYSMQKRYRPKDEPFVSGSFWDNTFVFAGGGVEKLVPREPLSFGLGPVFRLGAGKWWRPYHGVRVALAGEFFVRDHDSEKVSNFGVDVEHLFNLNAYLGGYKPGRFLEVWTVEGLGYRYSSLAGEGKHVVDLHVGLNLNMRIGERMDFFVEPRVTFYSDAVDHSADVNWHRYDVGYGGMVGLAYRFLPSGDAGVVREAVPDASFLSVAVGQQFQYSDLVRDMGIGNSLGTHVGVALGKWFTRHFAMRVSCFMSSDKWRQYQDGSKDKTRYLGLRLEGMLDLCALVRGQRGNFSLPLMFGPEIGSINKAERDGHIRHAYLGITGGMQLKYRVLENMSLFLEPRYSLVPYSHSVAPEVEGRGDIRTNYYDDVFNFNIGVEFTLMDFR